MTDNGKLDRSALTQYEEESLDNVINEKITTEEVIINVVSIFKDIIQTEEIINKQDNIFDLGITSLTMMTITQKIEERFKVNIPIEMLFEGPEINEIAIFIYDQLQRNLTVQKHQKR
ncbi:acyl carrier protein [Bacillus cereus]